MSDSDTTPRHTIVAEHAEATRKQIKALTLRRLAARRSKERDAIDAVIVQVKDGWWETVKPLMARNNPDV